LIYNNFLCSLYKDFFKGGYEDESDLI